ncbi:MAG: hypothetical protein HYX63_24010 [Gammaproteobacteria bacterium]|nr:hypothetical protein [Gammaproteobacteria bacterium]
MLKPISTVGAQVGLALLYSLARPGTAISNEAALVQTAANRAMDSVERSRALFGNKATAISQVWALAQECSVEDWDGNGSLPIKPVSVHRAIALIRALPADMPLPEFAPDPDGAISLDWIRSRSRLFSLSVGDSDRLAYAWLDGSDSGHGVARFDGEALPLRVLQGIASIMEFNDAAIGIV